MGSAKSAPIEIWPTGCLHMKVKVLNENNFDLIE